MNVTLYLQTLVVQMVPRAIKYLSADLFALVQKTQPKFVMCAAMRMVPFANLVLLVWMANAPSIAVMTMIAERECAIKHSIRMFRLDFAYPKPTRLLPLVMFLRKLRLKELVGWRVLMAFRTSLQQGEPLGWLGWEQPVQPLEQEQPE
jgi:hypothetical protein